MFNLIKKLFKLITKNQKKRFISLQIMVLIMAFMEIISLASIIPFMTLVGNIGQLHQDSIIAQLYKVINISSQSQFLFLVGVGVLLIILISSIFSIITTWRISIFATSFGAEISDRLYNYYIKKNWLFHLSESSAQLTKKIAIESQRVTRGIIMPLMQLNARLIVTFLICISIFIYDPIVALAGVSVFTTAYLILFRSVRRRLQDNGKKISEVSQQRFHLMNEGFGGIKDILILGRDEEFINQFKLTGNKLAYSQGTNAALSQVPRYLMELVAFGSMISLLLYLIGNYNGNLGVILPIISVYAIAGFKLLPSFQQIYSSISTIKGNIAALESIEEDLMSSEQIIFDNSKNKKRYLYPKKKIELENIFFRYPNKSELTLNNVSFSIPVNSYIGIVGPSGSGKTTIIDILLGLIDPQKGRLKVDDIVVNLKNKRLWQNTIGFVAQNIFLSDATIAENIAFGISKDEIDLDRVMFTLKLANLIEFIESLEKGIHSNVGERGIQLSGGQRQRIAIARALYHNAEVLIFDEATSSLDGITEKMIMKSINDFIRNKTIILVAHRLNTVEKCDKILFVEKGKVVDQGTYEELIKKNEHFKKMALNA